MMVVWKVYGLKSLYDEVIYAVDDFWGQWVPTTATPMKKEHKKGYAEK